MHYSAKPSVCCRRGERPGPLLGGGYSEGADEQHELPALVLGHASLEGRHGFPALADLVEERSVGDRIHMRGVGKVSWFGIVPHGIGAISFAGFAVTLGAILLEQALGRFDCGFRRLEGVPTALGLLGDDPRFVLLKHGDGDGDENEREQKGEDSFSHSGTALLVCGHAEGKSSHN